MIYTSGSTGKPRGVLLSHAGLVNYLTATSEMCGVGQSDRMLQFCSVSFDIAIEEMFTIWVGGGTLVLRTAEMSLAVPEFLAWVEKQKITILDLPTAYWHEWVHNFAELKRPVPPSVRLVIVGGEKAVGEVVCDVVKHGERPRALDQHLRPHRSQHLRHRIRAEIWCHRRHTRKPSYRTARCQLPYLSARPTTQSGARWAFPVNCT